MDLPNEGVNYSKETSTKIKLKFDQSTIQIAEHKRNDKMKSLEEHLVPKHVIEGKETTPHYENPPVQEKIYPEYDLSYMSKVQHLNLDILDLRNRLSYSRKHNIETRTAISNNQFITSHQLPLFIQTQDGSLFYDGNDKLEPKSIPCANFIELNIKNQHGLIGNERNGNIPFAPRRRRRGTGKLAKRY